MIVRSIATLVCIVLALPAAATSVAATVTRTHVTFHGDGGLLLHGIIVAPVATGRFPGLVMIGGSGASKTTDFDDEAAAFAARGVVTLIYNKRTTGYSDFHRDYSMLARDAIGGVSLLRTQSDVDPSMVGVFGLSEGAWVAPLAATRTNDIAYVITVGAAGGTPAQQIAWQYREWLRHANVGTSLQQMMHTATRVGVAFGLIAEANYDGASVWQQVRQPVLALWGVFDRHDAPAESSRLIEQALERGGNRHYTIRFIPNAQHDLHVTRNRGFDNRRGLAPGYADTVGSWVNDLSHNPPPASTSAPPVQDVRSAPLPPLAWYESGAVLITAFFFMLLVFGSYPLVALYRRLFHRTGAIMPRWPMRVLATCGFVTAAGFFLYFAFLVSSGASHVGPVVFGNPIPWLALRVCALTAIASTAWTAMAWYRHAGTIDGGRLQISLLLAAGAVLLAWAIFWSMLLL